MTKIAQFVESYEAAQKKFKEESEALLKEAFREFFESAPEIKGIKWTQYTPYFNDGDPCVFGVNEMSFTTSEEALGDHDDDEAGWDYGYDDSGDIRKKFNDFAKEVGKLPDSAFANMFGDHVSILATPTGFKVEEYSHD